MARLGVAQAASDEIDAFIKGFDMMSLNGIWPRVDLAPDAPIEKVVEAFAKTQRRTTDAAQFEGYRIVETKKLTPADGMLNGDTVVLIASARGSETMLFIKNLATDSHMKAIGHSDDSGWIVRPYYITTVP